jgi:hypothetical protein
LVCTTLLAVAATLAAQQTAPKPRQKAPPATESATIGGKTITITYSSPGVNGRAGHIFTKDGLIGHDKTYPVWRAGANTATILQTDADLDVGTPLFGCPRARIVSTSTSPTPTLGADRQQANRPVGN